MDPIARKAKNYRNAANKSPFREWLKRTLDGEMRNRVNSESGESRHLAIMGTVNLWATACMN
jgi:hypothetical protein